MKEIFFLQFPLKSLSIGNSMTYEIIFVGSEPDQNKLRFIKVACSVFATLVFWVNGRIRSYGFLHIFIYTDNGLY